MSVSIKLELSDLVPGLKGSILRAQKRRQYNLIRQHRGAAAADEWYLASKGRRPPLGGIYAT